MKILSYHKNMDGSSYHRVYQPHGSMRGHVEIRSVKMLHEDDIKWCDLLVYSRHCPYSPKFLNEQRQKYGFKIVVDMDDWWEVHKDHPMSEWWSQSNVSLQIRAHMMNADAVICTHSDLAEIIPNEHVYVIPNGINYDGGQFMQRPTGRGLLYASTIMNWSNTTILMGSAKKIQHLDVSYVIAGYHDSPYYTRVIRNLTSDVIPYTTKPWTNVHDYMNTYEGHIGILPSRKSYFNAMKSNLKVLEFAALGIPVIVSNEKPYQDLPVNYFGGIKEFAFHVEQLHMDKSYREKQGDTLHDFCREHYHLNKFVDKRTTIYNEIIQRGHCDHRQAEPSADAGLDMPAVAEAGLPYSDL